jgi:3-dehydroquinate synthase
LGAERDTTLLALGGGTITDLVGFVASIYMRGIAHILLPTTLLAIVDAAIGGKTGIDLPIGKNLLGTLHSPIAIFADLATLRTLPEAEWFNGLAEMLKLGLIADAALWQRASHNSKDPALIRQAIQGKIDIVARDPTELGLRRILNFGHTIGHALEAATGYTIPHGRAVALGCLVECDLSRRLGYLSENVFEAIYAVYRRFALHWPGVDLHEALRHDKKKAAGEVRFVCIDAIGHALPFDGAYCRPVPAPILQETLDWMEGAL